MKYEGLRATVMGLGLFGGGLAVARWLVRAGASVTVTDTATEERLASSLESLHPLPIRRFTLGGHQERDFREADLVVVNPAVRPDNPWLDLARKSGAKLTSELELFLENCPARLIGVTGTNGKSTTAAMISSILKADGRRVFLGGNIGKSLLEDVSSMDPGDWVVLELSSFQLHHLSPGISMPEIAVITNFSPNHLNWHPDVRHYAAAKQRLLAELPSHGTAVFDPKSRGLSDWQSLVRGRLAMPASGLRVPNLAVPGDHNVKNARLAAAAASCVNCRDQAIEVGLLDFRGLPDRLEAVQSLGGRHFFNDSSSTTPESTIAALAALPRPIWLLAGGAEKGVEHDELARRIAEQADGVVLFGQIAGELATNVTLRNTNLFCHAVKTLDEAFALCVEKAPPDATIVLSPGFSSHDQFVNFRARGAAFVKLVQTLSKNHLP